MTFQEAKLYLIFGYFIEHLETLDKCMADIESSCNFVMSDNDTAEITKCGMAGKSLTEEIDACIKPSKTAAESCDCFINLSTVNLEICKSCNISAMNDASKNAKKKCTQSRISEQAELKI